MPTPDAIESAVARLSAEFGHEFKVTDIAVTGTDLYVVYAENHPLPDTYTVSEGLLGFRVPANYPDACPEDSFFIQPASVKLKAPDPARQSTDIHRAGEGSGYLTGAGLSNDPVLVFSWHLWNARPWNRGINTLSDHYSFCLRRFEHPEHD